MAFASPLRAIPSVPDVRTKVQNQDGTLSPPYVTLLKGTQNCLERMQDAVATQATSVTVSALPAATGLTGVRYMVSDANSTTFNATAVGGGVNVVPVFSNGTVWKIG